MIKKGINTEWSTLRDEKSALRERSIPDSDWVRQNEGDRIVGTRLVLTSRLDETGIEEVKARICAQGHKDPDVMMLVQRRLTAAPTVSSIGRWITFSFIEVKRFFIFNWVISVALFSSAVNSTVILVLCT
jgi:hypothetical protein